MTDAFIHRLFAFAGLLVGTLALDDHQWDAVDEQHNIRDARLVAPPPLHHKLVCDLVDVVGRIFPVNVVERETAPVPVNRLFDALAQRQQLVHLLAGRNQPLMQRQVVNRPHPSPRPDLAR